MYKYVQRRLKDFVERTYHILDVKKTWTCQEKPKVGGELVRCRPTALECVPPAANDFGSAAGAGEEKCHRRNHRYRHQADYFNVLSAITWVSLGLGLGLSNSEVRLFFSFSQVLWFAVGMRVNCCACDVVTSDGILGASIQSISCSQEGLCIPK